MQTYSALQDLWGWQWIESITRPWIFLEALRHGCYNQHFGDTTCYVRVLPLTVDRRKNSSEIKAFTYICRSSQSCHWCSQYQSGSNFGGSVSCDKANLKACSCDCYFGNNPLQRQKMQHGIWAIDKFDSSTAHPRWALFLLPQVRVTSCCLILGIRIILTQLDPGASTSSRWAFIDKALIICHSAQRFDCSPSTQFRSEKTELWSFSSPSRSQTA